MKPRALLERVQSIAPLADWNAETNEKFVHSSGAYFHFREDMDVWQRYFEAGGIWFLREIELSEVEEWIDDLAASIGYIEPDSIQIPYEYVDICREWYDGQSDMLYAVCSTGNLTLGVIRPYNCDTLEKWYLSIWRELSIDVSRAVRAAKGKKGVSILRAFEKYVDKTCVELAKGYGLEDWDD